MDRLLPSHGEALATSPPITDSRGGQQMNTIEPYNGGGNELAVRDYRRAGRAISRNRAGALVRVSGTDADTDVAQAKIDNLTMATGSAMSAVVRVTQAQRHLEQLVPEAAGRLAFL